MVSLSAAEGSNPGIERAMKQVDRHLACHENTKRSQNMPADIRVSNLSLCGSDKTMRADGNLETAKANPLASKRREMS